VTERWRTRYKACIFLIEEMDIPHTVGLENPYTRCNARYKYIKQMVPKIILRVVIQLNRTRE